MNLYAQLVNNISMIIYLVCKLLTIVVYDIFDLKKTFRLQSLRLAHTERNQVTEVGMSF
jgi:hypothetical protein